MFNILCIIQAAVPSTEISIIRPFTFLEQTRKITWRLVQETAFHPDLLKSVQIVIFHRNCHPNGLNIWKAVQKAQLPIIYEIDDNYFNLPEDLPIGRYMRNPYVVKTLEFYLNTASIVKIGSPELLPFVSKYNRTTIYQPYAVDLNIINNLKLPPNPLLNVGYAGSIHHDRDFQFIINPIHRIAKEFPKVHWDFIGCAPAGLATLPNHKFTPFIPNYTGFLQELYLRNWQIGLCPILDQPHNRCKTDNKLREYGACRIPGIYSNIPPYSTNVKHGVTGLLVANTEQAWYEAIKLLISDENLRRLIATQVRQWVEQHRSIPVVADLWLELFARILKK